MDHNRDSSWTIGGVCTAALGILYLNSSANPSIDEYYISSCFLALATFLTFLGNRRIEDPSFVFILYFALHYSVMIPLYGDRLAWSHFAVLLENNWPMLCQGNFGALLGIGAYALGILLAGSRVPVRPGVVEWLPAGRARRFAIFYGIVGFLGWALIVLSDDSPLDAIFGRPSQRRAIFGYYQILLFSSILSFVCYQVYSRGRRFWRTPNVIFLLAVLLMNSVKGARLDLVVILLTTMVLVRLLSRDGSTLAIPLFVRVRRHILLLVGSIGMIFTLFLFTTYRSGLEVAEVDLPGYLHSLADSAGYLITLDRFPREFEFWYGKSFLHPLVIYIPSAIFPNKYNYTYGITEFTEIIFGQSVYNDPTTTSHTYTVLGEAYINLGWVGIFLSMLFFGFLNRRIFLRSLSTAFTRYGAILYSFYYSACVPYAVKSGLVSGFEFYFQNVLVMFALPVLFLSLGRRQSQISDMRSNL